MQARDPWYQIISDVIDGAIPAAEVNFSALSPAEKVLFGMRKHLYKDQGVIYRRWQTTDGTQRSQLVTPTEIRREVFRLTHETNAGGHLGARRITAKIKRRYFWPGLVTDVKQWILACDECASRSTYNLKRNKMQKYQIGAPMERVAMDVMGPLPRTTQGNKYILVIGDYFTKWIEAFPMPNQEATTIAEVFTGQFVARYGVPQEIHTDQGRNFESELMKNVCRLLEINKTRTTAFRPQSDGFIERFNRTLQQIIALFVNREQTDWDKVLPLAVAAYRGTPQETTGQSPNLLMLGREVNMPVDLLAGQPPGEKPETRPSTAFSSDGTWRKFSVRYGQSRAEKWSGKRSCTIKEKSALNINPVTECGTP